MRAKEQIWQWVWLGFYSSEEILEMMMEETWQTYFDYKTNADTLQNQNTEYQLFIDQYLSQKTEAEITWKTITDIDRLEVVFEILRNEHNIAAIHLAGSNYDEAIENIEEVFEEMEEETPNLVKQCCFYLESDAINLLPHFENSATRKGDLPIYFGQKEGTDSQNIKLGQFIFDFFKINNFEVKWSQKPQTPILIQDFEWENRGEDWDE